MVPAPTAADTFVEDTYVKPQFGLIEFLRRIREDQLSVVNPELFSRNMTYARLLFLDHFLIIKPEYIEHVLLTNHANYRKSHFLRHLVGPLLGNGLLISEGEFWRRQRRSRRPRFTAGASPISLPPWGLAARRRSHAGARRRNHSTLLRR